MRKEPKSWKASLETNREDRLMRNMLACKIHRATVTEVNIDYEGSITIDSDLMEAADILPFEAVHVLDIQNGNRFQTYAIEGKRGSGVVGINGAAARLVQKGDTVIILAYRGVAEEETAEYRPRLVYVDEKNAIKSVGGALSPLKSPMAV
jgi:aspartate 1-decarboxylase